MLKGKQVGGWLTSRSKYSLSLPYFATTGLADLHTADAMRHIVRFIATSPFLQQSLACHAASLAERIAPDRLPPGLCAGSRYPQRRAGKVCVDLESAHCGRHDAHLECPAYTPAAEVYG